MKLRGAKKEAFLKRMAAGRKKAAKANGGKAKKKNPSVRKSKKVIAKGFGKDTAAEWAKAKRRKKAAKKNPRGRRNQEPGSLDAAAQQFERFHGKPPGKVIEYDEQMRYPEHFAELGKLIELRFYLDDANPNFALTRFGACQVVSTPDGSNIYFIGGDQSVDLAALNIASDKDLVELGPCTYISYHTIKGFHDFEPTTYFHEFGEEDGIFPSLVYDRLNRRLFLTSGNYRIRPEGIVN
jgi:hypothetical protein